MSSPRMSVGVTAAIATSLFALTAATPPAHAETTGSTSVTQKAEATAEAKPSKAQQSLEAREQVLDQLTATMARDVGIAVEEPADATAAIQPPAVEVPAAAQAPATTTAPAPAPPKPVATTPAAPSYVTPVPGATLTAHFGDGGNLWGGAAHNGLDFAAPYGTPIKSVAAGTVTTMTWDSAYGNRVVVKHGDGSSSTYNHLSGTAVRSGAKVTVGQTVGYLGSTGNSTGPHLHLEILNSSGSTIDPLTWLRNKGVAL